MHFSYHKKITKYVILKMEPTIQFTQSHFTIFTTTYKNREGRIQNHVTQRFSALAIRHRAIYIFICHKL